MFEEVSILSFNYYCDNQDLCVVCKTLELEAFIIFANETVLCNVTIIFTTIAELQRNAYW